MPFDCPGLPGVFPTLIVTERGEASYDDLPDLRTALPG